MHLKKISRRQICRLGAYACSGLLLPPVFAGQIGLSPEKRTIPSSGEKLPVVGVGTWRTFDAGNNQQKRETLKQVLRNLVDKKHP
ncbi:MAG TPA: hypothetical protein VFW07_21025 [Parafilimonas sp.]|nr:hypothetical protein [Parafilimonas sp.]